MLEYKGFLLVKIGDSNGVTAEKTSKIMATLMVYLRKTEPAVRKIKIF